MMAFNSDDSDNKTWSWRIDSPFSNAVEIKDQIFISGQPPLDEAGKISAPNDIANQTRHVFENMRAVLRDYGLGLENLVRLNTYYMFDGADEDATEYWGVNDSGPPRILSGPGACRNSSPYQGNALQRAIDSNRGHCNKRAKF